jgi:hypothetical protein
MSKRQWLMVLGVWVMAFLFLGFPGSWDEPILALSGLIIVAVAYRLKVTSKTAAQNEPSGISYVEHHAASSDPARPAASSGSSAAPSSTVIQPGALIIDHKNPTAS